MCNTHSRLALLLVVVAPVIQHVVIKLVAKEADMHVPFRAKNGTSGGPMLLSQYFSRNVMLSP